MVKGVKCLFVDPATQKYLGEFHPSFATVARTRSSDASFTVRSHRSSKSSEFCNNGGRAHAVVDTLVRNSEEPVRNVTGDTRRNESTRSIFSNKKFHHMHM